MRPELSELDTDENEDEGEDENVIALGDSFMDLKERCGTVDVSQHVDKRKVIRSDGDTTKWVDGVEIKRIQHTKRRKQTHQGTEIVPIVATPAT